MKRKSSVLADKRGFLVKISPHSLSFAVLVPTWTPIAGRLPWEEEIGLEEKREFSIEKEMKREVFQRE